MIKHLGTFGALAMVLAIIAPTNAQAADFAKDIWPIIEAKCVKCHMAPYTDPKRGRIKKPKAGLRLDTAELIMKGADEDGEWEKVVIPGKPEKSHFYTLTILDPDHDDIMPPKGDPLTKKEQELVKAWIAGGAKFGDWTKGDLSKLRKEMGIKE
jgi:uncharacterized membrane protein